MSGRHPKNPRKPRGRLRTLDSEIATYVGPLWRIHATSGPHPSAWNDLRTFGPLSQFRWDPHPPPPKIHDAIGVSYTAEGTTTTFAEVFQQDRAITLSPARTLSGWEPSRPLELLDLIDSDWAIDNGASASLPAATKDVCRGWAQAIWRELGARVDGLRFRSTVTGDPAMALFSRASTAFPPSPSFSRPLPHPNVVDAAVEAASRLGWPEPR